MKTLRSAFLAIALLTLPAGDAAAGNLEDGLAAFEAGREADKNSDADAANTSYRRAYDLLLPLAEAADPEAQYRVGYLLDDGLGRPEDDETAFQWYVRAGLQGHARARNVVGYFFSKGIVVEEDDTKAECWYRAAAEQGLPVAQHNMTYVIGFFELTEAEYWESRAVRQGFPPALYLKGYGPFENPLVEDKTEALFYLLLAAERGHEKAQRIIDQVRTSSRGHIWDQLATAEEMAAAWEPTPETPSETPPPISEECLP